MSVFCSAFVTDFIFHEMLVFLFTKLVDSSVKLTFSHLCLLYVDESAALINAVKRVFDH